MNTVIITQNTDASWNERASERPTMPAMPSAPPSGESEDEDVIGHVTYGRYLATLRTRESKTARLESTSVLRISSPPSRVRSLPLDAMSIFLVGQIDGASTAEEIVARSGLPESDTFDRLWDLMALGVVEIV